MYMLTKVSVVPRGQSQLAEVPLCCHWVVTIRHPVADGVADKSDKSTTSSVPLVGMASELLESGVHAEFGLLHTAGHPMVLVKEVLRSSA